MRIEYWSITDVGKKRDHNEDNHLASGPLNLFMVADGMGGHRAGDTASRIAVETVEREVRERIPVLDELTKTSSNRNGKGTMVFFVEDPVIRLLVDAVQAASGAILDKIGEDQSFAGMGTTSSLIFFYDGKGYFAHVGDSRIYRIHGDAITQVSTDHSLVQEQVEAGLISRDEAQRSSLKNIITRSVGFERNIQVDCSQIPFNTGDYFLLCSDGLSNLVAPPEIREILTQKDPATALQFFVNLANSRGGDDNITVVLVRIAPDEPAQAAGQAKGA